MVRKNISLAKLIAILLIAIFLITSGYSISGASPTFDEPPHLAAGITYFQTGDARLNSDHPPFARLVAALPSLVLPIPSIAESNPEAWATADVMKIPINSYEVLANILPVSRLIFLSFSAMLGWLIFSWGSELFGENEAILPLALYAFCPPLLANAPIVATDLPITLFIFASVYGWWRFLVAPSLPRLAITALAVSLAFSTKFTAILLVPTFLILGMLYINSSNTLESKIRSRTLAIIGGGLLIGICTVVFVNLIYLLDGSLFTLTKLVQRATESHNSVFQREVIRLASAWPEWLPLPLPYYYLTGVLHILFSSQTSDFITYFMGAVTGGGSPNYPIVMLLIKLPIPTLVLVSIGIFAAVRQLPKDWKEVLCILVSAIIVLSASATSDIQIGVRHILPAFPFLFLITTYALIAATRRWEKAILILLVVGTAWSNFSVYPYYLMYFNFLAGGPDNGWRISTEGDDWGQGASDLTKWLKDRHISELAFTALGWSSIELRMGGIKIKPVPCHDTGELVAIHVRRLMRTPLVAEMQCHAWMRLRPPDEKIGYSIFLYNSRNATQQDAKPTPPNELGDFQQALKLQLAGNLEGAISLYQDYLRREPSYFQARFNLGHALMSAGRCAEAIPEFQRTLELWPGYTETHVHLARCHRALNQMDFARKHEQEYEKSQRTP